MSTLHCTYDSTYAPLYLDNLCCSVCSDISQTPQLVSTKSISAATTVRVDTQRILTLAELLFSGH